MLNGDVGVHVDRVLFAREGVCNVSAGEVQFADAWCACCYCFLRRLQLSAVSGTSRNTPEERKALVASLKAALKQSSSDMLLGRGMAAGGPPPLGPPTGPPALTKASSSKVRATNECALAAMLHLAGVNSVVLFPSWMGSCQHTFHWS